jgi:hypothetical protein
MNRAIAGHVHGEIVLPAITVGLALSLVYAQIPSSGFRSEIAHWISHV